MADQAPFPTTEPSHATAPDRSKSLGKDNPVYRPLSVLALASLVCSVGYALFVLISFLVAYFHHKPLLLNLFANVFGMGCVILSLIALYRIRNSEETLAGRKLAQWGLGLGGLTLALYGVGYTALFLAVTRQAEDYAADFLAKITKGDIMAAYLMSVEPANRQQFPLEQRDKIETFLNRPEGVMQKGQLSTFATGRLVRAIQRTGANAKLEARGVIDLRYTQDAYQVVQNYVLTTPDGTTDITISTIGKESPQKEFQGRQWQVVLERSMPSPEPKLTPTGVEHAALRDESFRFASLWLEKMKMGRLLELYLDTVPPGERKKKEEARRSLFRARALGVGAGPMNFLAMIAEEADMRANWLPDVKAVLGGTLFQDKNLWTEQAALRTAVPTELRQRMAQSPQDLGLASQFDPDFHFSVYRQEDDRFIVVHPLTLRCPPKYLADAELVVEADLRLLRANEKDIWRVVSINLLRGYPLTPPELTRIGPGK